MWRRATRRWRPQPVPEVLAPPTPAAGKDGSFYRPALLYDRKAKIPNVPQGPRDKSAKKVMKALSERRLSRAPAAALANPSIRVACLLERLPVVQLARTSWQLDMETVQAFKFEETRRALPKGMFDVWAKESPKWCVETFKEHFRHRAEDVLPLVTPSQTMTADQIAAAREEEQKQQRQQEAAAAASKKAGASDKKKKKKKESDGAAPAAPKDAAEAAAAAPKKEEDNAGSPATLWHKEMQDLGIELEEVEIEQMDDLNLQFSVENDEVVKEEISLQPRVTEADRTNDTRSLRRKLDCKLYLVVKQQGKWTFPSAAFSPADGDDNLVSTAERASSVVLDAEEREGDVYFVSMVPQGWRVSDDGKAKEFFLRGQLLHGGFDAKQVLKYAKKHKVEDVQWLTPAEIGELFAKDGKHEDEVLYVNRMLADDWWQEKDSDQLSPVLDEESRRLVKDLSQEQIHARLAQEEARREEVMAKL